MNTNNNKLTLGTVLKNHRTRWQFSSRDVAREAKKLGSSISSGHLSLIENDKVKEPTPKTLEILAKIYGIDYLHLMVIAGYLPEKHKVNNTNLILTLTHLEGCVQNLVTNAQTLAEQVNIIKEHLEDAQSS